MKLGAIPRGDGSEEEDLDSGDEGTRAPRVTALPSYVPSEASGMDGDANADGTLAEFATMPELVWESGSDGSSDGEWAQEAGTHGDGVDEEELQPHGQFGMLAGNW